MVAGGIHEPDVCVLCPQLVCNVNCAKQGSQGASWPLLCSEKLALCLPCDFTHSEVFGPWLEGPRSTQMPLWEGCGASPSCGDLNPKQPLSIKGRLEFGSI